MAYAFLSVLVLAGVLVLSDVAGGFVPRLAPLATSGRLGIGSSAIVLVVAAVAWIVGAATQTSDQCSASAGMDTASVTSLLIAPSIVVAGLFGLGLLVAYRRGKPSLPVLALPLAVAAGVVDVLAFAESFRLCFEFM
jgi:hypothetical protein